MTGSFDGQQSIPAIAVPSSGAMVVARGASIPPATAGAANGARTSPRTARTGPVLAVHRAKFHDRLTDRLSLQIFNASDQAILITAISPSENWSVAADESVDGILRGALRDGFSVIIESKQERLFPVLVKSEVLEGVLSKP
jgi:hypothetical protein